MTNHQLGVKEELRFCMKRTNVINLSKWLGEYVTIEKCLAVERKHIMKIAFNALGLNPGHNGGAESVFLNLVKGFAVNMFKDDLVFFCYPKMSELIKSIYPDSTCVVVSLQGKENLSRFEMLKIQSFYFHKIYREYDFDVILFANPDVGIFSYSVPTVVIPHDIQYVSRPEINRNRIQFYRNYFSYRVPFRIVDKIVCISDIDKREIENCYPFTNKKTVKIYDPIDISNDSIRIKADKDNYILAVNIQYPHKNIETLIRAFALISSKFPNLTLKLVGANNEYTKSLEGLAESLSIRDKVEFMGFISKELLDDLWSSAKLYVNPSLYEGFGMTSVESILHGAPTLLSDIEVNHEVTEGLCEYYDQIQNTHSLSAAIERMLEMDYNVLKSKEKAEVLVQKYCLENISKQYLNLLSDMVAQ